MSVRKEEFRTMGNPNFAKILLGLDGSNYAEAAKEYACEIALTQGATITGVAIIDLPGIQSTGGPVPLGGAHYELQREGHLLEETQEKAKVILDEFEQTCEARKIKTVLHADTGSPFSEIIEESKFHDFTVIGKKTFFGYSDHETFGTLEKVLKNGLTPVLAVPDSVRKIEKVLVAYDNSIPAAKVVHMFLLLGIWNACDITLLTVSDDSKEANTLLENLDDFFQSYGIQPNLATRSGHPDAEVKSYIAENEIDLLVMGAYGRKSVREFFVGSVTQHLIQETDIPLFLYH
jgi:nucleotide-binding universal stress UspA family protein